MSTSWEAKKAEVFNYTALVDFSRELRIHTTPKGRKVVVHVFTVNCPDTIESKQQFLDHLFVDHGYSDFQKMPLRTRAARYHSDIVSEISNLKPNEITGDKLLSWGHYERFGALRSRPSLWCESHAALLSYMVYTPGILTLDDANILFEGIIQWESFKDLRDFFASEGHLPMPSQCTEENLDKFRTIGIGAYRFAFLRYVTWFALSTSEEKYVAVPAHRSREHKDWLEAVSTDIDLFAETAYAVLKRIQKRLAKNRSKHSKHLLSLANKMCYYYDPEVGNTYDTSYIVFESLKDRNKLPIKALIPEKIKK